jgi:hypothetical protein
MTHVVKGAVNTLIVCWADNPTQIEKDHPEIACKLRTAWEQAFPGVTSAAHASPTLFQQQEFV